jgi:hypothetical protein
VFLGDILAVKRIPVIYQGKEYVIIFQYESGYCEIVEEGEPNQNVKLVHSSELKLKEEIVK